MEFKYYYYSLLSAVGLYSLIPQKEREILRDLWNIDYNDEQEVKILHEKYSQTGEIGEQ